MAEERARPLVALLSAALVAFTIEADDQFEQRMPHRTTVGGRVGEGPFHPWLVSLVMWTNALRHIPPDGIAAQRLESVARTRTNLPGLERWGYVTVGAPATGQFVRLTPAGDAAAAVWAPLVAEIEAAWAERFGATAMEELRQSLLALPPALDTSLPAGMPILGFGLRTPTSSLRRRTGPLRLNRPSCRRSSRDSSRRWR